MIKAGLASELQRCAGCKCAAAVVALPTGDLVCTPCMWVAKHKS